MFIKCHSQAVYCTSLGSGTQPAGHNLYTRVRLTFNDLHRDMLLFQQYWNKTFWHDECSSWCSMHRRQCGYNQHMWQTTLRRHYQYYCQELEM